MNTDQEKKGFFERLFGGISSKKNSCCGSIEMEEIPDDKFDDQENQAAKKNSGESCCK